MTKIRFCSTGKIAYVRRENAKRKIRTDRELPPQYHRKGRRNETYYLCEICGFYHTTSHIGTPENGNRKPI